MGAPPENDLRLEGRNRAIDGILSARCGERPTEAGRRALEVLRRGGQGGAWRIVSNAVRPWLGWAAAAAAIMAALVLWRHDARSPAPVPAVSQSGATTRPVAAPGIARIHDLSRPGQVFLRRAGTVLTAEPGTVLLDGDIVETGDGLARLQWFRRPCPSGEAPETEATDFELERKTVLQIGLAPDGAKRGRLDAGGLDCEVAPQPADRPLSIVTPHVLVRVVGTAFTLQVATAGTGVEVSKGLVDLVEISRAASVVVAAGQCARTEQGTEPTVVPLAEEGPRSDPDAGMGTWEGEAERTLRSVPRLVVDGVRYRLRAYAGAPGDVAGVLRRIGSGEERGAYRVTGLGPEERFEQPGRRVHAWIDVVGLERLGDPEPAEAGEPVESAADRRRGGEREE